MNNKQKAYVIARYFDVISENLGSESYTLIYLTEKYLTDLNWLIPVAIKVYTELLYKELGSLVIPMDDVFRRLEKNENGHYQYLFNEVYAGIIIIQENQYL